MNLRTIFSCELHETIFIKIQWESILFWTIYLRIQIEIQLVPSDKANLRVILWVLYVIISECRVFYQIMFRPTEVYDCIYLPAVKPGKWSLYTFPAEKVAWTPSLVRDRAGYIPLIAEHIHLNP